MAQVTIYMENSLESKIKQLAKDAGVSISKFISNTLEKSVNDSWNNETMKLEGSWKEFASLEDIRDSKVQDTIREEF